MRLDKLVGERFGLSRRAAQDAVRKGRIDVAGQPCLEPGRDVDADAPLAFDSNRPRLGSLLRRLDVLYEDRQILVIDKPAGLLTQPTQAHERDTLLERAGRVSLSASTIFPGPMSELFSAWTRTQQARFWW